MTFQQYIDTLCIFALNLLRGQLLCILQFLTLHLILNIGHRCSRYINYAIFFSLLLGLSLHLYHYMIL